MSSNGRDRLTRNPLLSVECWEALHDDTKDKSRLRMRMRLERSRRRVKRLLLKMQHWEHLWDKYTFCANLASQLWCTDSKLTRIHFRWNYLYWVTRSCWKCGYVQSLERLYIVRHRAVLHNKVRWVECCSFAIKTDISWWSKLMWGSNPQFFSFFFSFFFFSLFHPTHESQSLKQEDVA